MDLLEEVGGKDTARCEGTHAAGREEPASGHAGLILVQPRLVT